MTSATYVYWWRCAETVPVTPLWLCYTSSTHLYVWCLQDILVVYYWVHV